MGFRGYTHDRVIPTHPGRARSPKYDGCRYRQRAQPTPSADHARPDFCPGGRIMGRFLALFVCLAVSAGPASAQLPTVAIFDDSLGIDCNLSQTSPGVLNAYIVLTSTAVGVTGVQFAAPKPACLAGSYLTDV